MRAALSIIAVCGMAVCGCTSKQGSKSPANTAAPSGSSPAWASLPSTNQPVIVTPETATAGTVVLVNARARHVVLNFPLGKVPPPEQRLSLYRRGLKVGEVKTTSWQRENNIIADLIAGEAEVGDDARMH